MFRSRRTPTNQGWLLLIEEDGWQVVSPEGFLEKAPFSAPLLAEQAAPIHAALLAAGWRGAALTIGLAPALCVAATVQVPAPQMLRKPQAMRFHVEGWIPWSAEEFVADYVPHKTEAFMAVVRIEPLRTLLTALEELDVNVDVLAPAALLALERHMATADAPPNHVLIWRHGDVTELFVLRDGRPLTWRHAGQDIQSLAAVVQLDQCADLAWLARGLAPYHCEQLAATGISVVELPGLEWEAALRAATERIAAGDAEPYINLRRDELAGTRPVRALGRQLAGLKVAAVVAMAALCAALWIRGEQFADAAGDARDSLTAVYERTFPKNPVPDRVAAALRREHAMLDGTRGAVQELPGGPSSDAVLDLALAALPSDLRFRVPEVRVDGASVYLTGEVRGNADADRIALELRTAGFEVQPPRTQRLSEQGFSVHWTAQWPPTVGRGTKR